jgi:hypothetical protein
LAGAFCAAAFFFVVVVPAFAVDAFLAGFADFAMVDLPW